MNCHHCGKWAGANAILPGQPIDHLCACRPVERRSNRKPAVTQKQVLDAVHEYAWTYAAHHGCGHEVTNAHAAVVALLSEAGLS